MEIERLKERLFALNKEIASILEESGYNKSSDLPDTKWDEKDPDDTMLYQEFSELLQHLDYVHGVLDYLEKPVTHEGILTLNQREKYEIDGLELQEGDILEVLTKDPYTKNYIWEECYIPNKHDHPLIKNLISEGKKARIRGEQK
ncbi:MAG: hypothetical protein NC417_04875 [Candidatus Gastranaerophilales bacterium]|nr:hypothetical protein [Candidatus Gastranaerophilales bacterium]